MFQYSFINFNKCTTVRQDVNDRENCAGVSVCMSVCLWERDYVGTWYYLFTFSVTNITNEMEYTGLICIYLYIFVSVH